MYVNETIENVDFLIFRIPLLVFLTTCLFTLTIKITIINEIPYMRLYQLLYLIEYVRRQMVILM